MTRPALFLDLEFEAALERSKLEGKLLLVDATAEWCQPCKAMDAMTWSNETVAARLGEIAIPIQLDVDQRQATAQALRIKAMPTVVLFRDGVELARISGTRGPEALLRWVDDALAGRAEPDPMAAEEKAAAESLERFKLFRSLLEGNALDEAAEHAIWLWNSLARVPALMGVKYGILVPDLTRLAAVHPRTVEAFRQVRDATPIDGEGDEKLASIRDWVALNTIIGDAAKTIEWFDRVADTLNANAELAEIVRLQVVPVLVERAQWRDVGRAYPDPVAAVRKNIQTIARISSAPFPPAQLEAMRESAAKELRDDCARIVRGLRAAGRTEEATEVAATAIEADPSPEMKTALADV